MDHYGGMLARRFETREVAGRTATFTFLNDDPVARCGRVEVVLHYHPGYWPETPWSVEPFGKTDNGGFWHYSGWQFAERPTREAFIETAVRMFEIAASQGEL